MRGYRAWLRREFPGWAIIGEGPRLGFGAAMIRARLWLLSDVGESVRVVAGGRLPTNSPD